jgi:hypothetical protein
VWVQGVHRRRYRPRPSASAAPRSTGTSPAPAADQAAATTYVQPRADVTDGSPLRAASLRFPDLILIRAVTGPGAIGISLGGMVNVQANGGARRTRLTFGTIEAQPVAGKLLEQPPYQYAVRPARHQGPPGRACGSVMQRETLTPDFLRASKDPPTAVLPGVSPGREQPVRDEVRRSDAGPSERPTGSRVRTRPPPCHLRQHGTQRRVAAYGVRQILTQILTARWMIVTPLPSDHLPVAGDPGSGPEGPRRPPGRDRGGRQAGRPARRTRSRCPAGPGPG